MKNTLHSLKHFFFHESFNFIIQKGQNQFGHAVHPFPALFYLTEFFNDIQRRTNSLKIMEIKFICKEDQSRKKEVCF